MKQLGSDPNERADWRRANEIYRQFSDILNDPEEENTLPDELMGSLAESLSRVLAHYEGQEQQFMDDLFYMWSDIEKLPGSPRDRFTALYFEKRLKRFQRYQPSGRERRRPKPFEASIETCRRLLDLNRIRDALADLPTAGILGGSVSYGRFFNVCGAAGDGKPSDSDLLLVIPDYDLLSKIFGALQKLPGFHEETLEEFGKRIEFFNSVRRGRPNCIMSHKFRLWEPKQDPYLSKYQIPGWYLFSIHIFSREDFDFLIVKDMPVLKAGPDEKLERSLWDYRNTRPERKDNQRSFSGRDKTLDLVAEEAEGGFVSHMRVCHIEENRFYPGLHQNLILPQFEIRWDSRSMRLYLPVIGFRWKILERLRDERQLRASELQNLSLSHTRSAHFSPHVARRVDRD